MAIGLFEIDSDVAAYGYSLHTVGRASDGTLWAIYGITTSLYARSSSDNGKTWSAAELVVTEGYTGSDGIEACLVVDSSGIPHIVYSVRTGLGGANRRLYYLRRDPVAGWTVKEDIFGAEHYIKHPRAALDSSDDIHVAYKKGTLGTADTYYVKRTAGVWGAEFRLANYGGLLLHDSQDIAVDKNDFVHIVFCVRNTGDGWFAHDIAYRLWNGAWQPIEFVTTTLNDADEQRRPRIALDASDDVHLVWTGEGYGVNPNRTNLQYRKRELGVWQPRVALTDVAVTQGYPYGDLGIALDRAGNIHICWGGSSWSVTNPGWSTGQHIQCVGGVWGAIEVISDYNGTTISSLLWANHPGLNNIVPAGGFAGGFAVVLKRGRVYFGGLMELPVITTNPATLVTSITATLNGFLDDDGGEIGGCDCCFEYGETIAYGTTTPIQSKVTGESFLQALVGLSPGTTYHFRAVATNAAGTSYGIDRTFFTPITLPTVTTSPVTGLGWIIATFHGLLNDDGGEICECGFEWGKDITYGATSQPQDKITGETFEEIMLGLFPDTEYHYRAYATNSVGTAYGADVSIRSWPGVSEGFALSRREL